MHALVLLPLSPAPSPSVSAYQVVGKVQLPSLLVADAL
jgi:hypothetical protein